MPKCASAAPQASKTTQMTTASSLLPLNLISSSSTSRRRKKSHKVHPNLSSGKPSWPVIYESNSSGLNLEIRLHRYSSIKDVHSHCQDSMAIAFP